MNRESCGFFAQDASHNGYPHKGIWELWSSLLPSEGLPLYISKLWRAPSVHSAWGPLKSEKLSLPHPSFRDACLSAWTCLPRASAAPTPKWCSHTTPSLLAPHCLMDLTYFCFPALELFSCQSLANDACHGVVHSLFWCLCLWLWWNDLCFASEHQ